MTRTACVPDVSNAINSDCLPVVFTTDQNDSDRCFNRDFGCANRCKVHGSNCVAGWKQNMVLPVRVGFTQPKSVSEVCIVGHINQLASFSRCWGGIVDTNCVGGYDLSTTKKFYWLRYNKNNDKDIRQFHASGGPKTSATYASHRWMGLKNRVQDKGKLDQKVLKMAEAARYMCGNDDYKKGHYENINDIIDDILEKVKCERKPRRG